MKNFRQYVEDQVDKEMPQIFFSKLSTINLSHQIFNPKFLPQIFRPNLQMQKNITKSQLRYVGGES